MMQMFTSPRLVRTFAEPFVVVLAPHMDDEVIGPGGTIALYRQAGQLSHMFFWAPFCCATAWVSLHASSNAREHGLTGIPQNSSSMTKAR
jgi:hypothetical protein